MCVSTQRDRRIRKAHTQSYWDMEVSELQFMTLNDGVPFQLETIFIPNANADIARIIFTCHICYIFFLNWAASHTLHQCFCYFAAHSQSRHLGIPLFSGGTSIPMWGNDKVTWKEVIVGNGPPNLNSSSVLLLDFWVSHRFSIINTMLKLKVVHRWSWYLATLGRRLMIDFVVVSSDLQSHILDNRMKTGWSCKLTPT